MTDRWEERKEQLATFRAEYSLLFPDLHFFQGLRFAVLGATLPLEAGLFTVYRTALPIVQNRLFTSNPPALDPPTAMLAGILGALLLLGVYSVELGIRNQTAALIARGVELEEMLGIEHGAFTALKNRVRLWEILRISGIISTGFYFGLMWALYLVARAIWAFSH